MQYINDIEKMHKKFMIGELHPFELYKWIISYERIIKLEKKLKNIYPLSSTNIEDIYKNYSTKMARMEKREEQTRADEPGTDDLNPPVIL